MLPFRNDEQRAETEMEANEIHSHIVEKYHEFGFSLITVPIMSVKDRIDFIVSNIPA